MTPGTAKKAGENSRVREGAESDTGNGREILAAQERRLEERHIVVGEAIPADLVIADSDQVEESQPTRRGRANR